MRVLSGVVYMMNRNGPRTEPRGTPHETFSNFGYEEEVGDRTVVRELVLIKSAFLKKRGYGGVFKNRMELTRAERPRLTIL